MEKEKEKPRRRNEIFKQTIFNCFNKEMEVQTKEFIKKNPDESDIRFYLFQTITGKQALNDMLFKVIYFYDKNFIGNRDFIQIPNLNEMIYNIANYPVILASRNHNGINELIGVTTIKYEKNNTLLQNPYFPTKKENILTITGILTKLNNDYEKRIPNIGKILFKSSIKGAYDINLHEKVRLICKIDCRNKNSLIAISKAVKDLQSEGLNIQLYIDGYYEILNRSNKMTEAPTFVVEVDLKGNKKINNSKTQFSYINCNSKALFFDLKNVIINNTHQKREYITYKKNEKIIYHKIKPINALNVELIVGNVAEGNNREPVLTSLEEELVIV